MEYRDSLIFLRFASVRPSLGERRQMLLVIPQERDMPLGEIEGTCLEMFF